MSRRTWLLLAILMLSLAIGGCGRRVQRAKQKETARPATDSAADAGSKSTAAPAEKRPTAAEPAAARELAPLTRRDTAATIVQDLEDEKEAHEKTRKDLFILAEKYAEAEREIARLRAAPPAPQPEAQPASSEAVDSAQQRLLALARGFYDENRYSAAKEILETLVNMGHKGGYARFMLGRCYSELGLPEKAIECYKMACDFYEPADPKPKYYLYALNNLGALLRDQKRYAEAKVVYERAQAANPDYAAAYYNLGVLCADYLNDKQSAIQHFQKYVDLKGERAADIQQRIRKLLDELKAEGQK
ncbi:MAG: tetratricopeptide repeat protein [Planctomycetota bacterium]